jgi:protein-S-isoprenylcysteine O-methyltransferase Ste14
MNLPTQLGLIYLVSEVVLRFTRKAPVKRKVMDAGSLAALWVSIGLGIAGGIFVPRFFPGFGFDVPVVGERVLMGVFAAGLGLRWWSILTLGRFFTVDVAIADNHRLIASGPYYLVRHPSYTGMMLAFAALSVTFENWLSVASILVPISCALAYRIHVEEIALVRYFGDSYLRYQATTHRLIPWLL